MNKLQSIKDFVQEIFKIWVNEKPNQLAAALAYFGMLSFAAVFYIAYFIAGIFINEAAAAERLYTRRRGSPGSRNRSVHPGFSLCHSGWQ